MPELEEPIAFPREEGRPAVSPARRAKKTEVPFYDFRNAVHPSPAEAGSLWAFHDEFARHAAAGLSGHLGLEFSLKLVDVKTISFQQMAQGLGDTPLLTLFKTEPLRGISVLGLPSPLCLGMLDRLMGGPGTAPAADQELTDMEQALLEQPILMLLEAWCNQWAGIKELQPAILGYENSGSGTITPDAAMLVVTMQATMGQCHGQIQMGFPQAAVAPLTNKFSKRVETPTLPAPAAKRPPAAGLKWNPCFDDVRIPVSAEWEGLEVTARQILNLKVGDVLSLGSQHSPQINLRVADTLKFQGRAGTAGGKWAVELTGVINR
jgi:flagellar motor switch protein FliM